MHDDIRDAPSENFFSMDASATITKICERVLIEIHLYLSLEVSG